MRTMNWLVATVGAVVLASSTGSSPATGARTGGNPTDIDKSVVSIATLYEGVVSGTTPDGTTTGEVPSSAVFSCTGWFVSDVGHVASAGHCFEDSAGVSDAMVNNALTEAGLDPADPALEEVTWQYRVDATTAYVSQPSGIEDGPLSGDDPVLAQILEFQGFTDGDNALLRIANMKDTPALPVAQGQPEVGEEIVIVGFPGNVSSVTDVTRQPPSHKQGTVSSLSTSNRGVPQTEVDASTTEGMSGGPALNDEGAVIGITSSGFAEGQSFNFITDTDTMRTFFDRNGVDITTARTNPTDEGSATPSDDETPSSTGLSELKENSDQDGPLATQPEESGPSMGLVAGGALLGGGILAALIILLVLQMRKRKSTPKP